VSDVLRIANCSGFYGDRFTAFREQLEGGPVDVVTGDYLAELTMLILARSRAKDPEAGYARTFVSQLKGSLELVASSGAKVVTNAGGLAPGACATAIREAVAEAGLELTVAAVEGDDLLPRLDELRERYGLDHLDTGEPLATSGVMPLTANAYLGGWGIAAALDAGADIVVTGRVTDASLVVGPAAWRFGWARDDWDRLAGAVVAGHVIECGAHATGGNYSSFQEVPGLEHPGFPIAEVAADGSSVITKHPGTGGLVSVGTVTAQLVYEIGGPLYLNPDVTTDLSSVRLQDAGDDRVRISGVRGAPPPATTKLGVAALGGFRNRLTFVLTGLDIDAKADLVRRTFEARTDLDAIASVEWDLVRSDHEDADRNAEAMAMLTVTAKDSDAQKVGRRALSDVAVGMALSSYPGFTMTAPPGEAEPFGVFWPATIPSDEVTEVVVLGDDSRTELALTAGVPVDELRAGVTEPGDPLDPDEPTTRVPLGRLVDARSGDKGGHANVGFWVRSYEAYQWLCAFLTEDRLRELLPEAGELRIDRYPLPNLLALNFVVHGLLGLGVSESSRPDPQAKGLGEYLRSRHVDLPTRLLRRSS
jgi:hypothetical protein